MDENHQDIANNHLTTTEDVEWVVSKKSKLLIPQHINPRKRSFKVPFNWLNLIGVLLIPFVVTVIGLYATQQITQQQTQSSQEQHKFDLQIASDQQQETTLQTYLDRLSTLLLDRNISKSKPGDEVRNVARAQTLIVLPRLNSVHKGLLILFLYESELITGAEKIVDLHSADLSGVTLSNLHLDIPSYYPVITGTTITVSVTATAVAITPYTTIVAPAPTDLQGINLSGTNLYRADLSGIEIYAADLSVSNLSESNLSMANLSKTDLTLTNLKDSNMTGTLLIQANLSGADLRGTDLSGADLAGANLTGAKVTNEQLAKTALLEGATMPDGSIHP